MSKGLPFGTPATRRGEDVPHLFGGDLRSPRIPGPSFRGQVAFSALVASSWSPAQAPRTGERIRAVRKEQPATKLGMFC